MRLAVAADEDAVVALTLDAYSPYVAVLGYQPLPMNEDYGTRIRAGQVWLLETDGALAALLVLERHADHALIYSVAVAPVHHGEGLGSAMLGFAEEQARV